MTTHLAALDVSSSSPDYHTSEWKSIVGYTASRIRAPDALLQVHEEEEGIKEVRVDPSWEICLWNSYNPSHLGKERYNNWDSKQLVENGPCKGFLSDACVAALGRTRLRFGRDEKGAVRLVRNVPKPRDAGRVQIQIIRGAYNILIKKAGFD